MAKPRRVPRSILLTHTALVALWLLLAFAISAYAIHASFFTARLADIRMQEAASGLMRMADTMSERGVPLAQIRSDVRAAGRLHDVDVTIQAMPMRESMRESMREWMSAGAASPGSGKIVAPGPPPFPMGGFLAGPDPFEKPTAVAHANGMLIIVRATEDPWGEIVRAYVVSMALLLLVALIATWIVQRNLIARALAPVVTVESALRRLAAGEHSRLEVIAPDPEQAGVVDAYNAAADELASSVRLRAEAESNLRQFVADAGHELRTPLTVIMGFVEVLRQGAIAERALAERLLDSVAAEGERMRRLIARLLLLARLDAVAPDHRESVDLSAAVSDAVEAFRPLAGDTKLAIHTVPGLVVVGSTSDVREVVAILIDNALKYAPGSNVVVATELDDRFGAVTVTDDGPGMPPEVRARAFDRFSRGDERGSVPGSGLGLAIAKRIAVRAGGDADLQSTPGRGTQVRVRFPLAG